VYKQRAGRARRPRRLVRQCAWCGRVADAEGRYGGKTRPFLRGATYGICRSCLDALLDEGHEDRAD
jgi:hypothetical protein